MDLVLQINLEKHPRMDLLWVMKKFISKKKLKWNNEPFEIPEDILNAWREIGEKGAVLEEKWLKIFDKKKKY